MGFLKSSFVGTYGTLSNNPSDSNIKTGDIVQYDWETDNLWDHSTICVGKNAAGQPIICSHTTDYYKVHWDYGTSKTQWRVINITPTGDDFGNTMQTAGHVFRSTLETVSGKIYPGDVDFIEFTPYATKIYRVFTTGSTDTYGELYNSAGILLKSNDDDGDGLNFLIKQSLTAGNSYYVKIRHYNSTKAGSYNLVIHDNAMPVPPTSVCGEMELLDQDE